MIVMNFFEVDCFTQLFLLNFRLDILFTFEHNSSTNDGYIAAIMPLAIFLRLLIYRFKLTIKEGLVNVVS
jgi:hypothetical protein